MSKEEELRPNGGVVRRVAGSEQCKLAAEQGIALPPQFVVTAARMIWGGVATP